MAAYIAMEKFFSKHVGGRFQEEIEPEIQKRLDEITVDVSTVEVASKEVNN